MEGKEGSRKKRKGAIRLNRKPVPQNAVQGYIKCFIKHKPRLNAKNNVKSYSSVIIVVKLKRKEKSMKKSILLGIIMILIMVTVHILAQLGTLSILEYWFEFAKNVVK